MLCFSLLLLLVTATVGPCGANYSELGLCPKAPRQADLQPARLIGVWYEQMRYLDPGFQARCTRWHLKPASDGLRLKETRLDAADGTLYETVETLRPAAGGLLSSPRFNHIMAVSTDYTGHAVFQLCRQYDGFHARTVVVMTRERELGQTEQRSLRALLDGLREEKLLTDRLVPTPQEGCPDVGE